MTVTDRNTIEPLPGFQSREAASFLAQLDDQSRRLAEATRDITPEELGWQPRPGMNTIGMLMTHLAIVEVWWTALATGREPDPTERILGIGVDDDGMPLPADGIPPAGLREKDWATFDQRLARARGFVKDQLMTMPESGMEHEILRTRADGTQRAITVRWILYHILEHFAGHFGQILLLRHLYRVERARG